VNGGSQKEIKCGCPRLLSNRSVYERGWKMAGITQILHLMHAKTNPPNSSYTKYNIQPQILISEFNITVAFPDNNPSNPQKKRRLSLALLSQPRSHFYPHSRVAFLRSSADLEGRRNHPHRGGVTPPYCPSGPPLSRQYIFEDEAYGERPEIFAVGRRYNRSLLSITSSASPTSGTFTTFKDAGLPAKKMPHALSMPQTGFQALILCGPGGSLNTFTTVPSEYPKALITLANRPMVWYVLDWCYRMGVTSKSTF
jgi:hypothetical protein